MLSVVAEVVVTMLLIESVALLDSCEVLLVVLIASCNVVDVKLVVLELSDVALLDSCEVLLVVLIASCNVVDVKLVPLELSDVVVGIVLLESSDELTDDVPLLERVSTLVTELLIVELALGSEVDDVTSPCSKWYMLSLLPPPHFSALFPGHVLPHSELGA